MKLRFFLLAALNLIICLSGSSQIFYKVSGNGLQKPSYIFGTHHLAPLSILDSISGVKDAFSKSEVIVGELDMTIPPMELAMKIQQFTIAPSDSTLNVLLGDDFDKANEKFKSLNISLMPGMTADLTMLSMLRPMSITSLITVDMVKKEMPGLNPEEQLDSYFQNEGKKNGKKIIGLETPEFQGKLLYTSIPIKIQAKQLMTLLDNPEKVVENAKELNESYLTQNLHKLEELSNQEMEPEEEVFMNALLDSRNLSWLEILPGIMNENSSFIAVGALHLAGEKGLIEGLREKGYEVEAVGFNK